MVTLAVVVPTSSQPEPPAAIDENMTINFSLLSQYEAKPCLVRAVLAREIHRLCRAVSRPAGAQPSTARGMELSVLAWAVPPMDRPTCHF